GQFASPVLALAGPGDDRVDGRALPGASADRALRPVSAAAGDRLLSAAEGDNPTARPGLDFGARPRSRYQRQDITVRLYRCDRAGVRKPMALDGALHLGRVDVARPRPAHREGARSDVTPHDDAGACAAQRIAA